MIKSVEVKHVHTERPKYFYQSLKHEFFQEFLTHVSLLSRDQLSALELKNEAHMVWDTLGIVPRNKGLETAEHVVPFKPTGTFQPASLKHNGLKQWPMSKFPGKSHSGCFSHSVSSFNWREDHLGRTRLESRLYDSDREDTLSEESFFRSSEDN